MQIKKITEKEYNDFALLKKQDHFLHSPSWGKTREKINWKYEILALKDENKILAVAIVMYKKTPAFNKYYAYIPRGMIIDYNDEKLLSLFTKEIKKYLSKKNVFCLTIDPDIILNELDNDYNIINKNKSAYKLMEKLNNFGFKHKGFLNNFEANQPRHTYRLYFDDKDYQNILSNMDKGTRYCIKTSKKFPLKVEESTVDNVEDFYKLMEETTIRNEFTTRDVNYYKNILNEFGESVKLFFVYINPKEIYEENYKKLEEQNISLKEIKQREEPTSQKALKKYNAKINDLTSAINKTKKMLDEIEHFIKCDRINLSTSILISSNKRAWYVYGASSSSFRNYYSNYFIYDYMINHCLEENYEFIDFFGVAGKLDETSSNHGLYLMKKGFGGDLLEFIGEYDLVINKAYYYLYNNLFPVLKKIRKKKIIKK